MAKALTDQLCSIEVKIENEDVYMVLLMSLPPSFDTLVISLECMSTKDLTFNSSSLDCFIKFPKGKKVKVWKMSHYLTKLIR
jgi:hypothetical protein